MHRVKESGLHSSDSAQIQMRVSCECGNESSGFIKCEELLEWLNNP